MLCQLCNEREANIHFTKIINGQMEERHLCDSCGSGEDDIEINLPISFHKLFLDLININQDENISGEKTCPKCGLTYRDLMEHGKFGCSKCYETFREDMNSLLNGIHGHNRHIGKVPKDKRELIMEQREIDRLRKELDKAVQEENFEKAALLRDEILGKTEKDISEE